MRYAWGMLLGGLLAGCAGPQLPLRETVAAPAGRFEARGETDAVVRTFTTGPDGRRREVGGALCDASSILFSAQVTTPARLIVPSFGPQSATLTFDCRAGALSGRAQQGVVTRWVRPPGPWGWPGPHRIGPPWAGSGGYWGGYRGGGYWGGGYWGGGGHPVFVYPDVAVDLR